MTEEKLCDEEISQISKRLINGGNVLLLGLDRNRVRDIQSKACAKLDKRERIYHSRYEWTNECASQIIEDEIECAKRYRASHLVIDSISVENYIDYIARCGHFCLFASLPVANLFSASLQLAKALQAHLGEHSPCVGVLHENALSALYTTGVSKSSDQQRREGSFREKLESARYNRNKSVLTNHGSLLRGWTQESEICDPGWELDK